MIIMTLTNATKLCKAGFRYNGFDQVGRMTTGWFFEDTKEIREAIEELKLHKMAYEVW